MKTFTLKKEMGIWMILALPLVVFMVFRHQLPARIPSHFDFRGHADAYMRPIPFLLTMTGTSLFLYFLFLLLPRIDPKKSNYLLFQKTYYLIRVLVHLLLSSLSILSMAIALGILLNGTRLFFLILMFFFIILGNYLGHIRPNWFVGIRTPWTLSNETVWKKTHQLGSKLMFFSGLVGFMLCLFLAPALLPNVLLTIILFSVLVPVVYSFLVSRKMKVQDENPLP
ncbi:MAG: SdpI family protein [Chitinophagaceae bacterium]